MSVEWKGIDGYVGFYEVSTSGIVRSSKTGRHLSPFKSGQGYLAVSLCRSGEIKKHYVAHLVVRAFIRPGVVLGIKSESLQVNHKDGVVTNNSAENLEVITMAQNRRHAASLPTSLKGEKNPQAKLSESDVVRIRQMKSEGMSYSAIASAFGVHWMNVFLIVKRKTWQHVA